MEREKYAFSKSLHGGSNMNIKFNQTQGKSLYEQLQKISNNLTGKTETKGAKEKNSQKSSESSLVPTDKLDLSNIKNVSTEIAASQEKYSERTNSSSGEITSSNGSNVSFQFDLFYSLTSKVEAKMGQSGAERFVDLSASVAETFQSSFSLSIDGVGSFMNGTDKSLDISPEVANDFFDAVEGLTKQGPEALENFLKKSDAFFNELEATYGNMDGAFDTIKEQVQSQAKDFIASVGDAQNFVMNGVQEDQQNLLDQASGLLSENSEVPENSEEDGGNNLIKMFAKPEITATQDQYKDFLNKFIEYANKMKESMFNELMAMKDGTSNSDNSSASNALKSLLDVSA